MTYEVRTEHGRETTMTNESITVTLGNVALDHIATRHGKYSHPPAAIATDRGARTTRLTLTPQQANDLLDDLADIAWPARGPSYSTSGYAPYADPDSTSPRLREAGRRAYCALCRVMGFDCSANCPA